MHNLVKRVSYHCPSMRSTKANASAKVGKCTLANHLSTKVIWVRIEPSINVVFVGRTGASVVACLDDFQRWVVRDCGERLEPRITTGCFDIGPKTGHEQIFTSRWREQDLYALLALARHQGKGAAAGCAEKRSRKSSRPP